MVQQQMDYGNFAPRGVKRREKSGTTLSKGNELSDARPGIGTRGVARPRLGTRALSPSRGDAPG
jgi:hypothetical protein